MIVTKSIMLKLALDRADAEGDSILMRGANMAAVSWVNRCGSATDKTGVLINDNPWTSSARRGGGEEGEGKGRTSNRLGRNSGQEPEERGQGGEDRGSFEEKAGTEGAFAPSGFLCLSQAIVEDGEVGWGHKTLVLR